MRHSPAIALLVAVGLGVSACTGTTSSATGGEAPAPTIGLGSRIEGADGPAGAVTTTAIDTVVMVGDSITVASRLQLETMFEELGFSNVVIESQEGKRTALSFGSNSSGAQVAENIVNLIDAASDEANESGDGEPFDHSNELWIVALGTNDIDQYSDPALRAAAINELLAIVPAESPLIWVDTYFRDRPDATAEINDTIRDRVGQRPNAVVAAWSAVAGDDGNLRDDGVHPREQGSIVFADVIGNTIIDLLQLG